MYHFWTNTGLWELLDGDKIACLIATYIQKKLKDLPEPAEYKFGCVQTAYANGASTAYLRKVLGFRKGWVENSDFAGSVAWAIGAKPAVHVLCKGCAFAITA